MAANRSTDGLDPITGRLWSNPWNPNSPGTELTSSERTIVLLNQDAADRSISLRKRIHWLIGRHENIQILKQLEGFSAELNAAEINTLIASGVVAAFGQEDEPVAAQATRKRRRRKHRNKKNKSQQQQLLSLGNIENSSASSEATRTESSQGDVIPWGTRLVLNGREPANLVEQCRTKYVFVIDTGISSLTGDLNIRDEWGYNFLSPGSSAEDDNGHGTHVAGTIGALANGFGIVGVAPGVNLISYKVLDRQGLGSLNTVVTAIERMLVTINNHQINPKDVVVNISFGAHSEDAILRAAITRATDLGIRFAIAAGNTSSDVDGSIGNYEAYIPASSREERPGIYVTSAITSELQMAAFSNYDRITNPGDIDNIAFAAPGENILSWMRTSEGRFNLAPLSGTSMAAAHLTGLLVLGEIQAGPLASANGTMAPDPLALLAPDSI